MTMPQLDSRRLETTELTGRFRLADSTGSSATTPTKTISPDGSLLSYAELRGSAAGRWQHKSRNLNLISTGELRFRSTVKNLLGAELPRVGITQILLGTVSTVC